MRLTIWDLLRALLRHTGAIVLTMLLSALAACLWVDRVQTCSAEVVLRYLDPCIAQGLAPDGSPFHPGEIIAPRIILSAGQALPFPVTEQDVRSGLTVTPILPAGQDEGQGSRAVTYRVSYQGNRSFYETRDTLDRLIDCYFAFYREAYLHPAVLGEIDRELERGGLDYLEQAELLQRSIDQAVSVLEDCAAVSPSPLAIQDVMDGFSALSQLDLPEITSKICAARLSRDPAQLLDRYAQRRQEHERSARAALERSVQAEEQGRVLARASLAQSWAEDRAVHAGELLAAQECQRILDLFSTPASPGVDCARYRQEVEEGISRTLQRLEELYASAAPLVEDCNAALTQTHLQCLTGIQTTQNVYLAPCVLLAVSAGLVLSCAAAVTYELLAPGPASLRRQEEEEKEEGPAPPESFPHRLEDVHF